MTEPQKYTKKPVEIEAMEWAGGNGPGRATPIIDWILENGGRATYQCEGDHCTGRPEDHSILIHTLEGDMKASPGDFVIRGTKGEFYPCKPDIFRNLHEMPGEDVRMHHLSDCATNNEPAMPAGPCTCGALRSITLDLDTGKWLEPKVAITHEQAIRIAISVLPGIEMDQLALWVDEQKFDQGPGQ